MSRKKKKIKLTKIIKVTAIPILGEKASNSLSISWNPSSSSTGYQVGIVVNETDVFFYLFIYLFIYYYLI